MKENEFKKEVGRRLKLLRKHAYKTQDQIANDLGLDQPEVSLHERGMRQITGFEVYKYAQLYKISTDYILCMAERPIRIT